MTIDISATRRVDDGLYAQVRLSDSAEGCLLTAQATVSNGVAVPVRVLHGDREGEWLLALADLSVTQTVILSALSWDGSVIEERIQRLNPIATRLSPPMGLLRRRGAPEPLSVPNARTALGEWDIWVDRLVATREDLDICHGHAVLIETEEQSLGGAVVVQILDARGREVSGNSWICLSDTVRPLDDHPGFHMRRIEFSLTLPSATPTLVVWVRPERESDLPTGFSCLGPRSTGIIRELWRTSTLNAEEDDGYDLWFSTKHAVEQAELSMQQDDSFDAHTSFSVVVVAHDASPEALHETVDSVLEQSYGHLELVLVNSAPNNQRLASVVREIELADARVHSVPLGADFGIAAATSEGIDAATGDFVCLLGENDLLAPDALWCLAAEMSAHPDTDMLYTDEDRIEHGRHVCPHFKPDWDPDLILGGDYVGSLLAVRTDLLRDMETMGRELDGAQSYHLTLAASRSARHIAHVPRVLYHARGDAARAGVAATGAARLVALRAHVAALDVNASVRASARMQQGFEVVYALPEEPPLVSVIVVNRDDTASLDRCLRALREHTAYENYEVVVVEHGSTKAETFEYYSRVEKKDPRVRTVFYQGEGSDNLARLINFGASRAAGTCLVLLAPDVEVREAGWMERLVSLCLREGTGAAGVRLVRTDETILHSGGFLSSHGPVVLDRYRAAADCTRIESGLLHTVTLASGCCLAIDAAVFREVGGMREEYPGRYGDADLCLRIACRGYRVVLDPQISAISHLPFLDDDAGRRTTSDLQAMGRLWESWPYGASSVDPLVGPNVSHLSAYRILRS